MIIIVIASARHLRLSIEPQQLVFRVNCEQASASAFIIITVARPAARLRLGCEHHRTDSKDQRDRCDDQSHFRSHDRTPLEIMKIRCVWLVKYMRSQLMET